ncbi:MAG: TIGR03032 family protein [Oscillatoria sp. SIO1A7]|nr:TIGR03032 family protein [Oscillatoria sp. SIO1A7]
MPNAQCPMPQPTIISDREFIPWLEQQQISLAFTTYQTHWLCLIGVNPESGKISAFQRQFNRAMGLHCTSERLYLSSKYQLWQLDNVLSPGQIHQGYDKLYIPRIGYTTGDLDVHDVGIDKSGQPIFISSLLNCLATTSDRNSCQPIWKPPFISKIINEDRCHLNGLAMADGQPRYVTACSRSDIVDGWRDRRENGGVVIDVLANEIILDGLSMPHSPRVYRNKLWLLNSGKGEFGYIELANPKSKIQNPKSFQPVAFCPGYARGLAFWENYAIIGLSKPRGGDRSFSGLALEEKLAAKDAEPRCGLLVIDLNTGATVHWLRIEGAITELYDVGVLPGVRRPMALGFKTPEIEQLITLDAIAPISVSAPTSAGASLSNSTTNKGKDIIQAPQSCADLSIRSPKKDPSLLSAEGLAVSPPEPIIRKEKEIGDILKFNLMLRYPYIFSATPQLVELASNSEGIFKTSRQSSVKKLPGQSTNSLFQGATNGNAARQILNRAVNCHQQQKFQEAIALYRRVLSLEANNIIALTNLGKCLQMLGRHEEAIVPLRQAIKLNPKAAQLHFYLSKSLKQQGNLEAVESCLREAIRLQPDFWGAYNNLGTLLQERENLEEASQCYETAISYNPNFAEARANLATVWQLQGELERAKEGFNRALQIQPNYAPAHLNLANIYKQEGRLPGAVSHYQQVISLEPKRAEAHFNLGEIFEYQGSIEVALKHYRQVQQLDPDTYNIDAYIDYIRLKLCDWENYEARIEKLRRSLHKYLNQETSIALSLLSLSAFPVSLELHRQMAESQANNISQRMAATKERCNFQYSSDRRLTPKGAAMQTKPEAGSGKQVSDRRLTPKGAAMQTKLEAGSEQKLSSQKLRVGYMSPDFRAHAVGKIVCELFENHDRSAFEIYCYSTVDYNDEITDRVRAGCNRFLNISAMTAEKAARQIRADGIDILIDLAGYTIGNRLEVLALQPAPVQAQFLGYPDTMGADFIQYALVDEWLMNPEIATSYKEELIYLPHAFFTSSMEISDSKLERSQFGLPEDGTVFCCFNSHYKINPEVFDVWMRVLQQVPNSVLWLSQASEQLMANLRREARTRGVEASRLVFAQKLPEPSYLARYRLADLFLDTFIYNAGSTAISALRAGCPVLTRPGKTNASRMGASICAAAELESLICASNAEYEERAIYLATHPEELTKLRRHLTENWQRLPLFDLPTFARSLEAAFWQMWEKSIG